MTPSERIALNIQLALYSTAMATLSSSKSVYDIVTCAHQAADAAEKLGRPDLAKKAHERAKVRIESLVPTVRKVRTAKAAA